MLQKNQPLLKVAIAIIITAALLCVLSIMAEGIGLASTKLVAICLSLIFFGITATICLVVSGKPSYATLGLTGMLVSALAFAVSAVLIIAEIADESFLKFMFSLFIISIALAHICLLHYFNLQNKYAFYARITASIAIAIFSIFLIMRVFEPFGGIGSLLYNQASLKLLFSALIIDLAATLLVPLCNRLKVRDQPQFSFMQDEEIIKVEEPGPVQPGESESP